MSAPVTVEQLLTLVRRSGVVDHARLDVYQREDAAALPGGPQAAADLLVRDGVLTGFQAKQLVKGRWRGFTLGKYRILENIGSGGMAVVYLCEHLGLRRRVAVKMLPPTLAQDPWFVERFYREGRALAALDHPHIVRAYDLERVEGFHLLAMEYVDGASLQEVVSGHGPLAVLRAAHYVRQAALGLQHIHEAGMVHRDVKPANLVLSRQGVVKILDMGLAAFFREGTDETLPRAGGKKIIVGTDDYLAPEQIVDSSDVDTRADVYALGATFYFLLTGQPPFPEEAMGCRKWIGHLTRSPRPLRDLRPEVPEELAAVIAKMLAKNPWERYQTPAEVAEALAAWTQEPISPPPVEEMPQLCPATQPSDPLAPEPLPPLRQAATANGEAKDAHVPVHTAANGEAKDAHVPVHTLDRPRFRIRATGQDLVGQVGKLDRSGWKA
jgi:serine/threonine protein kinase